MQTHKTILIELLLVLIALTTFAVMSGCSQEESETSNLPQTISVKAPFEMRSMSAWGQFLKPDAACLTVSIAGWTQQTE